MRNLNDFIDDYGLIIQGDGDAGDSANRVGMYGVAAHYSNVKHSDDPNVPTKEKFNSMASKVEIAPGIGVRHPVQWNSPNDFSRDQQTALVIGAALSDNYQLVLSFFERHVERLGGYQTFKLFSKNEAGEFKIVQGDYASPEHWGYYIRGLSYWFLYPYLLLSDLFMLGNSLIIVYRSYKDADDTSNDLNHICALLLAKEKYPTPIGWLARKVYSWFRKNAGKDNNNRLPGFGPQTALDWYFREESNAPPIDDLFRPFLEKELK